MRFLQLHRQRSASRPRVRRYWRPVKFSDNMPRGESISPL
jgi:hypothetical protein